MRRRFAGVLVAAWFAVSAASHAAPVFRKNVVVVTIDGFRWQEFFTGANRDYFKKAADGKPTAAEQRFWRDDPGARRMALLPFFWGTVASQGAIFGDPS